MMKRNPSCRKTNLFNTAFVFILISFPSLANAAVAVRYHYDAAAKRLEFRWDGKATAKTTLVNGKITIRFSEAVHLDNPDALLHDAGRVVSNVEYSDDTLWVTPLKRYSVSSQAHVHDVTLAFSPETASEENLGLALTGIRLDVEKGRMHKAIRKTHALEKQYPNHPDVLETDADIHYRTGHWRQAVSRYADAMEAAPEREDLPERRKEILREYGSFADLSGEYREIGNDRTEIFTRAQGMARVSHSIAMGVNIERDDVDADSVQHANDGSFTKLDDDFYRGEAYFLYTLPSSDSAKVSVFAGDGTVGGGLAYTLIDYYGSTALGLEVSAPNWDFIEGVRDEGTRDRVFVTRIQRFNPRFIVNATAGLNQYSVEDRDNVAKSATIDASAIYTIPSSHQMAAFLGDDADWSLRYSLDAEYASDVDTANGVNGVFKPLPLTTREVHTLALYIGKQVVRPVRVEAFGGYARDRLGDGGANYGGDVYIDLGKQAQLRAGYLHSVSTERTDEDLDSITVGLGVKF